MAGVGQCPNLEQMSNARSEKLRGELISTPARETGESLVVY
jgi:hypothetical protein